MTKQDWIHLGNELIAAGTLIKERVREDNEELCPDVVLSVYNMVEGLAFPQEEE